MSGQIDAGWRAGKTNLTDSRFRQIISYKGWWHGVIAKRWGEAGADYLQLAVAKKR